MLRFCWPRSLDFDLRGMTSVGGTMVLEAVIRPVFAVWITLVMNYQRALLYFILLAIGSFMIGITCLCGRWLASKLLPIERDIYQLRKAQRAYADEHINDTKIVLDRNPDGKISIFPSERAGF